MSSLAPGWIRARSTSSMRSSHSPPCARASIQLPTAASSEPRCSRPVGDGANRPRRGRGAASAVPVVPVAVLLLAPLAALLGLDRERRHRACLEPLDADLLASLEAVAVAADDAKLRAIPDTTLKTWFDAGDLGCVYAHKMSLGHLVDLCRKGLNAQAATPAA